MSLSGLPTELIVHVFRSVDIISSAAALSHTSRHFHTIWRYNLPSICDAVLPLTIECYDQAYQLLEARAKSDLVVSQPSVEERAKAAIVRAKVLFTNAHLAHLARVQFEGTIRLREWDLRKTIPGPLEGCACTGTGMDHRGYGILELEPFKCIRFIEGFHRAMSIVYLAGKSGTRMYEFLASMHLLDFFGMVEVMEWCVDAYWEDATPDENIGLPGYDSRSWWMPLWEGRRDGLRFLELLRTNLVELSGVEPPINDRFKTGLATGRPSYQLILHKDCARYDTDAAKAFALADLLPLLPKNSSFNPNYELSTPH